MAQYQEHGLPPRSNSNARVKSTPLIAYVASALILGIFMVIAASGVSTSIKNLDATISQTKFDSNLVSPSNLTVANTAEKKYLTLKEAAAYLNLTEADISAAISNGEIDGYIPTSDGYTISTKSLDEYFEQRSYEIWTKRNSLNN